MSRYTSLLEGMEVIKIAEAEGGYNYYLFSRWGRQEWTLMRENTSGTEYLFAIGKGSADNAWTDRAIKNYKKPSEFTVTP